MDQAARAIRMNESMPEERRHHLPPHVLGIMHRDLRESAKALPHYVHALKYQSQSPQLPRDIAILHMDLGEYSKAATVFTLLEERSPDESLAPMGRVLALHLAKKHKEAYSALDTAMAAVTRDLKTDPEDKDFLTARASLSLYGATLALLAKGWAEAESWLETHAEHITDHEALMEVRADIARLKAKAKATIEAGHAEVDYRRQIVRRLPDSVSAWNTLLQVICHSGKGLLVEKDGEGLTVALPVLTKHRDAVLSEVSAISSDSPRAMLPRTLSLLLSPLSSSPFTSSLTWVIRKASTGPSARSILTPIVSCLSAAEGEGERLSAILDGVKAGCGVGGECTGVAGAYGMVCMAWLRVSVPALSLECGVEGGAYGAADAAVHIASAHRNTVDADPSATPVHKALAAGCLTDTLLCRTQVLTLLLQQGADAPVSVAQAQEWARQMHELDEGDREMRELDEGFSTLQPVSSCWHSTPLTRHALDVMGQFVTKHCWLNAQQMENTDFLAPLGIECMHRSLNGPDASASVTDSLYAAKTCHSVIATASKQAKVLFDFHQYTIRQGAFGAYEAQKATAHLPVVRPGVLSAAVMLCLVGAFGVDVSGVEGGWETLTQSMKEEHDRHRAVNTRADKKDDDELEPEDDDPFLCKALSKECPLAEMGVDLARVLSVLSSKTKHSSVTLCLGLVAVAKGQRKEALSCIKRLGGAETCLGGLIAVYAARQGLKDMPSVDVGAVLSAVSECECAEGVAHTHWQTIKQYIAHALKE
ncbi:hypothetical protein KIPB_006839 [Kipferlia bialata]|uniref:Uncharacterized protein n=1 Tax=Kipferlia bialata TaxID=797122 RepID=A0A9K3D0V0_9EUKA|nr:hypothetical protein KIPB_006839 [Kipferlia bialata]|eukprot:g6839.t1